MVICFWYLEFPCFGINLSEERFFVVFLTESVSFHVDPFLHIGVFSFSFSPSSSSSDFKMVSDLFFFLFRVDSLFSFVD